MNIQDVYKPLFDNLPDADVDRTSALDQFYIPHPVATLIQGRAERLMRESQRSKGLAGHALMISGPSGVGKTEALAIFEKQVNEAVYEALGIKPGESVTDDDGMTKRRITPVVYYNVPERADLKDFYVGLLESLGDRNPVGSTATLRSRTMKAIKDAEAQIIIIDELQHLFDRENKRIKKNVADAIKRMLDVAKVPLIICGLDDARKIYGPTLETKRRTDWCITLKPYDIKDPAEKTAFYNFLECYDEALVESGCFKKSSRLSDELRGGRIHFAARGCVGHAARLIKAAGTLAIEGGSPSISDEHFKTACDLIFMQAPQEISVNPFGLEEMPAHQLHQGQVKTHARRSPPRQNRGNQSTRGRRAKDDELAPGKVANGKGEQ